MSSTSLQKIEDLNRELTSLKQQLAIANNNNQDKTTVTEDQLKLELRIETLMAQINKEEQTITSGGKRFKSKRRKTAKKASRRKSKRRNSKK